MWLIPEMTTHRVSHRTNPPGKIQKWEYETYWSDVESFDAQNVQRRSGEISAFGDCAAEPSFVPSR
jgi:hypothetical protein